MTERREKVYFVTDFFDTIRAGIADCQGRPRSFREGFDIDADCYTGVFSLREQDEAIKSMAIEADKIMKRYWAAYRAGRTRGDKSPRVLPDDRERYLEIEGALSAILRTEGPEDLKAHAEFYSVDSYDQGAHGLSDVEVTWTILR
jgi:hypothetical protein